MTLDNTVKLAAERAGKELGLPARFVASWWVAENGWNWPESNNVGNISFQGEGIPSHGVFEGVTKVNDNRTVDYKDMAAGVDAFCHLVSTPKADKALTLDLSDLHACGSDIHKMCEKVGESNWASSHYNPSGEGPGSSIWNVYNSTGMVDAFKDEPQAPEGEHPAVKKEVKGVEHVVITVHPGQTLSHIAHEYKTTVRALVILNGIKDKNFIEAGEKIKVPHFYKVKPGDILSRVAPRLGSTVEQMAAMNAINPNHIEVGWVLAY